MHEVLDRHGVDYSLAWTLGGETFLTPPGSLSHALTAAIESETGVTPVLSTTGGTSDGRFIARICPQVVEFGPVNASIHKIDENVRVDDIERLKNIYRAHAGESAAVKLLNLIERCSARLDKAGVSFGHGTTNAFDEAVWLALWKLELPLDDLDGVADLELTSAQQSAIEALVDKRIATRKPAAYLTGEAWLQGLPFYVDERVIVPRSLIAEPLADGVLDACLADAPQPRARPVHRQRQPGRAGGAGLARRRGGRHRAVGRCAGRGAPQRRAPWAGRIASACARAMAWPRPTAATT